MAIADLPVTILNDPELIDLGGRMAGPIQRTMPNDTWFGPLSTDIQSQIQAMNISRGRQSGSDLTDDIRNADVARDDAFLTLRAGLEFFQRKPEPLGSGAGRLLDIIRNREYSLQNLGDSEESVELNALLSDLDTPAAQADLTTVGLTTEIDALQQAQQTFDNLIAQRAIEESGEEIPSLPAVRKFLREDLAVLRDDLAFAERRDPVIFGALVQEVSQHITDVVAIARARRTRQESEEEPAPEPAPESV